MDVVSLAKGMDYRPTVLQKLSDSALVLIVIGPSWLSIADDKGVKRLLAESDLVRLETKVALSSGVPVIPILVGGAVHPSPDDLPEDIRDLAFRNGHELSHNRWASDVKLLLDALPPLLGSSLVLDSEGRVALDIFANELATPGYALEVIILVGHTDGSLSLSDSFEVSRVRTEKVKEYLIRKGIDTRRIYCQHDWKKKPIADNKSVEGRAKNNRVEIEAVGTFTSHDGATTTPRLIPADVYF